MKRIHVYEKKRHEKPTLLQFAIEKAAILLLSVSSAESRNGTAEWRDGGIHVS